jgi:hypothetical protein
MTIKIRYYLQIFFVLPLLLSCSKTTSIPIPTAESSPSSTPTIPAKSECPKGKNLSELTFPETTESLKGLILTYLNNGGNPLTLPEAFNSLALNSDQSIALKIVSVDISGDNLDEIIALAELRNETVVHKTVVWFFSCFSGAYEEVGYIDGAASSFDPKFISIEDLNGDNVPEVVIQLSWRVGCLEKFFVIGWNKSKAVDYLAPDGVLSFLSPNWFDCETSLSIQDQDKDGQKELVFTGEEQVGKFRHDIPLRKFIYEYEAVDMQNYVRMSEQYRQSPYRFYVLADAERALKRQQNGLADENYRLAESLYRKVVNDETLLDVAPYTSLNRFSKNYTTAFALFRLVIMDATVGVKGVTVTTNNLLDELAQKFPEGKSGHEFSEAANLFVEKIKEGKSDSVACSNVSVWIDETYPELQSNFDWGSVLTYDSGTFCPY